MADPFARFQSTHSQRVRRPWTHSIFHILFDFNPRTREGCDGVAWKRSCMSYPNFNPRTREGCDLLRFGRQMERPEHFNPRTREGCDLNQTEGE